MCNYDINTDDFFFKMVSQLSGLLVLVVGLWLRFDPETVELLTDDGAPDTFFIGMCSLHKSISNAYFKGILNIYF